MNKKALAELTNILIESLTVVNRLNMADYTNRDEIINLLSDYCRETEMGTNLSRDEFETLSSLREYLHDIIVDFTR